MKIAILEDSCDTIRTLPCFGKPDDHDVTVFNDHLQSVTPLAIQANDLRSDWRTSTTSGKTSTPPSRAPEHAAVPPRSIDLRLGR
jgi:hypothetical protein